MEASQYFDLIQKKAGTAVHMSPVKTGFPALNIELLHCPFKCVVKKKIFFLNIFF